MRIEIEKEKIINDVWIYVGNEKKVVVDLESIRKELKIDMKGKGWKGNREVNKF